MRIFTFAALLCLYGIGTSNANGQNTVGVLTNLDSLTQDGYNLHYPFNQGTTYLMDNCGREVHRWENLPNRTCANISYILPDGKLARGSRDNSIAGDPIWAGGGGEFIELRDWDNTLLWEFELEDSVDRIHHDFRVMPNGHILAVVWNRKLQADALAAGRDPNQLPDNEIWNERIIEIEPVGTYGYNIVWEWSLWDHLVQDIDSTKANYGVVGNHSELVDINFGDMVKDWVHINGIDYNADLDQILISAPTFNEIWIIDHSTTTNQAASHSGGLSGRGGDLLWRWGNPMAYRQGDSTNTQLHFQHDCHWVDQFLAPGSDPDLGKIMVFNNRHAPDHSAVYVISPQFDTYDWEYIKSGNTYVPAAPSWVYTRPTPSDLHSPIVSNAQRLGNGNTLITSGQPGYTFEVTPAGQIVWEFINPLVNGNSINNGDTLAFGSNFYFRLYRYPSNFSGFNGRSLLPGDYLANGADTTLCPVSVGIEDPLAAAMLKSYPNPAQDQLTLAWEGRPISIQIFDLAGKVIWQGMLAQGNTTLETKEWPNGLYILHAAGLPAQRIAIQR